MTHDELARSLADHLRTTDRMVWCDMQLGPAGSPRPDVYAIYKSFMRPAPVAYECKVSMSDFRADVTAGKWQSYLPFASGVYFACELWLLGKTDVPEHCGLIVHTAKGWRAVKKPTLQAVHIPQDAWLKLLIDGVEREGPRHRAKPYREDLYLMKLSARFGEIAAKTVRNRLAVEQEVEQAKRTAERIVSDARRRAEEISKEAAEKLGPMRGELCLVLGLAEGADRWQMEHAIAKLRRGLEEHPALTQLRRLTTDIGNAVHRYGFKEPESESESQA